MGELHIRDGGLCFDRTLNFNFSLISPLVIKYSMGIARGKTDRVDARRIAEYAITTIGR